MFSQSVEMLLNVTYREAVSRRHAHLTLEHLLYVMAHDLEGEEILAACGADIPRLRQDLDTFLRSASNNCPRGRTRTRTDARLPADPADGRAARAERGRTRSARATCWRRSCSSALVCRHAARVPRRDPARHSQLHLARGQQGAAGTRPASSFGEGGRRGRAPGRRGDECRAGPARRLRLQPDRARRSRQARSGDRPCRRDEPHARGALPPEEEQPRLRRRRRRRQDGDRRGPRAEAARRRRARDPEGRVGLLPRHRGPARRHALPRRLRGALQGGHRSAPKKRPLPSSSSTRCTPWSGPGPPPAARWTSPTSSSRSSPRARSGSWARRRSRSSSTSRRTGRSRRRVQRIDVDEPPTRATPSASCRGCARATRSTTRSGTRTGRSRWRRASRGGTCATCGCPTARST